jgi:aspartate aminotransferase-like enzyme
MPGYPVSDYLEFLKEERGIIIAGGLEALSGKIFRVGTMGQAASREYVMDYLLATEEFLRRKGHPVAVGQSLKCLAEE